MNYIYVRYICTHIETLIYEHYIGARPAWFIFFPQPHETSRAPSTVRAPHLGDHWSNESVINW
jgi:hypothetical protein